MQLTVLQAKQKLAESLWNFLISSGA